MSNLRRAVGNGKFTLFLPSVRRFFSSGLKIAGNVIFFIFYMFWLLLFIVLPDYGGKWEGKVESI